MILLFSGGHAGAGPGHERSIEADRPAYRARSSIGSTFIRRFLALTIVVIVINLCWQFFRAWMPKMLREEYLYSANQVQYFSIAYYMAADVGCFLIGFLTR